MSSIQVTSPFASAASKSTDFTPEKMSVLSIAAEMAAAASLVIWQPSDP